MARDRFNIAAKHASRATGLFTEAIERLELANQHLDAEVDEAMTAQSAAILREDQARQARDENDVVLGNLRSFLGGDGA